MDKIIKPLLILAFMFVGFQNIQAQQMTNDTLEKIFFVMSDSLNGHDGSWEFYINETPLLCFTDIANNRMRIISPVKEVKDLTPEELSKSMEANFHSALDVRYAISSEIMWVAFIHPLKELTKEQVIDAVSQVYSAALTFGTTYSSTNLVFPKQEDQEKQKEEEKKTKSKKT